MAETIKDIKDKLSTITDPSDPYLKELAADSRKGVQNLLTSWQEKQKLLQVKKEAFYDRFQIERDLKKQGYQYICGVDEVGRGPLAGPVVSAAVILKDDFDLYDVIDSKQLSDKKRRELFDKIKDESIAIGVGIIDAKTIDEINIYESAKLAMKKAVEDLAIQADYLIIDAMTIDSEIEQMSIIKGDAKSNTIGAASIIAKVIRDDLMAEYGKQYPAYDFENNAGYGTKAHIEAVKEHGITPIHRQTFEPIKTFILERD